MAQGMTDTPTGMSAHERDLRKRLDDYYDQGHHHENTIYHVPGGVLAGVLRDIEMWREISSNDIDKWSFDALMRMAKRMLNEVYPEDIFIPLPDSTVEKLRETIAGRDSGPAFVCLLRVVIREIEEKRT